MCEVTQFYVVADCFGLLGVCCLVVLLRLVSRKLLAVYVDHDDRIAIKVLVWVVWAIIVCLYILLAYDLLLALCVPDYYHFLLYEV